MKKNRKLLVIILTMVFSAFLAASAFNVTPLRKARSSVGMSYARKAPANSTLYGIVCTGSTFGYYSFTATAEPDFKLLFTHENLNPTGAAVYVDGKLYVNCWTSEVGLVTAKQYVYDVATGALDKTNDIIVTSCATALTYDKTTDRVYGQFYDEDMMNFFWGVLDLGDGSVYTIGEMDDLERVFALAAAPNGEIYAIDKYGKLVKINKATGHFSETIGETNIKPQYIQSAVFGADGNLYWAASTDTGDNGLYRIDTLTAKATVVSTFDDGKQIIALNPGTIPPSANAPKKIDAINLDFDGGELDGNVSFCLPSTTEDGTPLKGKLNVYLDIDMQTYTATGMPNETVTIPVETTAEDEFKFSAYTECNGVRSDRTNLYKWIGTDRPVLPSPPVLKVNGNEATLSWDKPVAGLHGGYVDPNAVTYDIIRYPEAKYARQAYTGTTFTETLDMTKSHKLSYAVIPVYGAKIGKPGYSNDYSVNVTAEVPVSYNLSIVKSDWDYFTVVDGNNDGYTWDWNNMAEIEGNPEETNDDWLITPAIHLKADRMYYLSYTYWLQNGVFYPQTYEIKAGEGTAVDDMTTTVLGRTKLDKGIKTEEETTNNMVVAKEGNYNIGFHNISEQGGKMRLLSVEISEGPLLTAPKAPEAITITPAEEGELQATVALKAPQYSIGGNSLGSISKIEVMRCGEDGKFAVVKTFTSPAPGETLSFDDNGLSNGVVRYKAVAYNADGVAGLYSEEASAYCGQDKPAAPANVNITVTGDYTAHVTWDAPTKGKNGYYVNPDELTYSVFEADDYMYGWDAAAEDISETECDVEYEPEGNEQIDCTYLIIPSSIAGEGDRATTKTVVFGPNYSLPYSENFEGGFVKTFFRKGNQAWDDEESGWTTTDSEGYGNANGCAFYRGYDSNSQSLISGKISLDRAENPMLSLRVKSDGDDEDGKLTIKVADDFSGTYNPVYTINCEDCADGWKLVQVPLAEFKTKAYIHIAFEATAGDEEAKILIDNILVRDMPKYDLAIFSDPTASPQYVKVGETSSKISVDVENVGSEDVSGSDYTVDFYNGNEKIGSVDGVDIEVGEKANVSFNYVPALDDAGTVAIKAVANYDADGDNTNNESGTVNVKVGKPSLPTVDNLTATLKDEGGVSLSWTAPNVDVEGIRVTDGFEDYEPFAISGFGDWTAYDADGQQTFTVGEFAYEHSSEPKAFQVFNPLMTSPALTEDNWQPYAGDQMLACFSTYVPSNDDWLISPVLSGKKQNISFMAKTADATYGKEKIEVWYSTTGTETSDFMKLTSEPYSVPSAWTECVYTLPEGAKYFAIRCVSSSTFALLLDDISFEKKLAEDLKIEGFNIYRNGTLVGYTIANETSFADVEGKSNDKYYVTTVYNMGESAPSETVTAVTSGIKEVDSFGNSTSERVYEISGQRAFTKRNNHVYIVNGKKTVVKTRK